MSPYGDVMRPNGSVLIPANEMKFNNSYSNYGIENIMLFDTVHFKKNTWDDDKGGEVVYEAINIRKGAGYDGIIYITSDTYDGASPYEFAIQLSVKTETGYFFFKRFSEFYFRLYLDSLSLAASNAQWMAYDNITNKIISSKSSNTTRFGIQLKTDTPPYYANKMFDTYLYYSSFKARILKWKDESKGILTKANRKNKTNRPDNE
jgi:hypothetical protein